jgi:hypothetical protein
VKLNYLIYKEKTLKNLLNNLKTNKMKQSAVEWIIEEINQQQKRYIDLAKKDKSFKKEVDAILTATTLLKMKCDQAKEMEKQQQGYSEEEVLELIQFLAEKEDFKEHFSMSIFIAKDYLNQFKNK